MNLEKRRALFFITAFALGLMLIAALAGASYVIATESIYALEAWVVVTTYCVWQCRRTGVTAGGIIGTSITVVYLALYLLSTVSLVASIGLGIAVTGTAFALFWQFFTKWPTRPIPNADGQPTFMKPPAGNDVL